MNLLKRIDNWVTDSVASILADPVVNIGILLLAAAVYVGLAYLFYRWPFPMAGLSLVYLLDKRWAR